ncbi:MAG TPA: hypothetical protein H9668_08830 [Firmicutes bacterium]|nr:hypothetical protein [Bacillota bacterium]
MKVQGVIAVMLGVCLLFSGCGSAEKAPASASVSSRAGAVVDEQPEEKVSADAGAAQDSPIVSDVITAAADSTSVPDEEEPEEPAEPVSGPGEEEPEEPADPVPAPDEEEPEEPAEPVPGSDEEPEEPAEPVSGPGEEEPEEPAEPVPGPDEEEPEEPAEPVPNPDEDGSQIQQGPDGMFAAVRLALEAQWPAPRGEGEGRILLNIRILAGDASEFAAQVQYYDTIYDVFDTYLNDRPVTFRGFRSHLSTYLCRLKWEDGRYQEVKSEWDIDYSDLEPADAVRVYAELTEEQRDICDFRGGTLQLSYDCGQSWIDTPYTKEQILDRGDDYDGLYNLHDGCSFMRDGLSAFVFGGCAYLDSPVTVAVTYDQGQSWMEVQLPDSINVRDFSIGFLPGEDGTYGPDSFGWLVAGHDRSMGWEACSIYFTYDGGRSWENSHGLDDWYSTLFSGAAFSSEEVGFLCFTSITGDSSRILRTVDGGKTWEDFELPLPEFPGSESYEITITPTFDGKNGVFELRRTQNSRARFVTDDGGLTWRLEKVYTPGALPDEA